MSFKTKIGLVPVAFIVFITVMALIFGLSDAGAANLDEGRTAKNAPFLFYPVAGPMETNKNPSVWLTLRLEPPTRQDAGKISITMRPCEGMGPFALAARTRHLTPGQESLKVISHDGLTLVWSTKLKGPSKSLRLRFQIPDLVFRGNPYYCMTAMAWAEDGASSALYTIQWPGETK